MNRSTLDLALAGSLTTALATAAGGTGGRVVAPDGASRNDRDTANV